MTVLTVEFESEKRYYWKCPRCNFLSLPFRDAERAAAEQGSHWSCRLARRSAMAP
jgi:hypothetical protein